NGLEVLRALRPTCNTPLLMLSARCDPGDRILGQELGAEDFLAKPRDPRDLVASRRALLRRATPAAEEPQLQVGDLRLDSSSLMAWRGEELLALTQTEALILRELLERPGQLIDRQQLSRQALGKPLGPHDRSLDMHMSNLRRKLGTHDDGRPRIQSIRGRGYLYSCGADLYTACTPRRPWLTPPPLDWIPMAGHTGHLQPRRLPMKKTLMAGLFALTTAAASVAL